MLQLYLQVLLEKLRTELYTKNKTVIHIASGIYPNITTKKAPMLGCFLILILLLKNPIVKPEIAFPNIKEIGPIIPKIPPINPK